MYYLYLKFKINFEMMSIICVLLDWTVDWAFMM